MNEAFRNLAVLLWAVCAINSNSYANDKLTISEEAMPAQPTVIMGTAKTPSGKTDEFIVEQPADSGNPLGNPIVGPNNNQNNSGSEENNSMPATVEPTTSSQPKGIVQVSPQGVLQNDEIPLPQNGKIENELYQDDNDIIDVQAYPINDVSTVTEPNLQPAVVNQ